MAILYVGIDLAKFHLSTVGPAQADDPSCFATIDERNVVESFGLWCESDHSHLGIVKPIINPDQSGFPIALGSCACVVCTGQDEGEHQLRNEVAKPDCSWLRQTDL